MTNEDSGFIDLEDFKSARIEITLTNLSTNKKIGTKSDHPDTSVILVEHYENEVKLEVPSSFCKKDQEIQLDIRRLDSTNTTHFEGKATVKELDPHQTFQYQKKKGIQVQDSPIDTVTLQFMTGEVIIEWNSFRAAFSKRQDEIEAFFKAAKG